MYKKRKELGYTWYAPADGRKLSPAYPATIHVNEFFGMTLGERAHIVRLGDIKNFKPDTTPPSKEFKEKYSQSWWDENVGYEEKGKRRNGDTSSFITNICLFGDRVKPEWKPPVIEPIDFYATITRDNALNWYESCPLHLRAKLEKEMEKYPEAEVAERSGDIYKKVRCLWGELPKKERCREDNEEMFKTYEEQEIYNEWLHEYDRQVAIEVILEHGPSVQQERKMLNEAMGFTEEEGFPMQSDGLDATQAATIRWIQSGGMTPLEFLVDVYRNGDVKMGDRLNAAKSILDFVHRKVPTKQEIDTKDVSAPRLASSVLKGLTEEELSILEKLLGKLEDKK